MNFDSQLPLVGILRNFSTEQTVQVTQASIRGGLKNLEITMNSPNVAKQIRETSKFPISIGAGTVIDLQSLEVALNAGAKFIVTPIVNTEVIEECVRQKIPVFPGAYTPTEIQKAWELGATMVKIFPAETLGPGYIKSLKAPLPQIKLMPTGGVDLMTLPAFIKAGADGFGVGGPLFDRARVEAGDWNWIEAQCRAFVEIIRSNRPAASNAPQ